MAADKYAAFVWPVYAISAVVLLWMLIDSLNRAFDIPVVERATGGFGGGGARSGVSECHFGAGVSCAFLDEMRCFDVAIGCWNIDQAQPWPAHLHLFEPGCVCKCGRFL